MITKELLEGQIKQLTAQKENALAIFNQADGALQLAKFLLEQVGEEPSLTEDEFAKMIAGSGARVESIEPSG